MIIKLPHVPLFFAEAKYLIHGFKFAPSPAQYQEGLRLQVAEQTPILIGWKDGKMHISPWREEADIRECFTGTANTEVYQLWEYFK